MGEWLKLGTDGVIPVRWDVAKSNTGSLTGYASVFNVVDDQDEFTVPGTFKNSLARWKQSGRRLPLADGHDTSNGAVIGSFDATEEDYHGLKVHAIFSADPHAQSLRAKAIEGHINGLSIFGEVKRASTRMVKGSPRRALEEVHLLHIALTSIPALMPASAKAAGAAKVSDTPWSNFSASDYTPEQWRRACLIDTGEGAVDAKSRYKLPVREPSGTLNRGGVHAAASALAGARGGLQASAEQKATAARKLLRLYSEIGDDPPDSLKRLAGVSSSLTLPDEWVDDMRAALTIKTVAARDLAVDTLVRAQYRLPEGDPEPDPDGAPDPGVDKDLSGLDASAYALSLIEDSGPGSNPSGSDSPEAVAELIKSIEEGTPPKLDDLLTDGG
jgi:HK97 family phage prohead protease